MGLRDGGPAGDGENVMRAGNGDPGAASEADDLAGDAEPVQFLADAAGVSIGDEDLPMVADADPVEEVVHATLVQLFEDIVEQEDGRETFVLPQRFVFCQLEGEEQTLALTLGSDRLEGLGGKAHFDIVLMDPAACPLQQDILLMELVQQVGKGTMQKLAFIAEPDGFHVPGDLGVELVHQGQEFLQEGSPVSEQRYAGPGQQLIIYIQQAAVMGTPVRQRAEKAVALLKDLIIFDEQLQVSGIQLRKQGVEETTAFLTSAGNDLHIVGSDDDAGEMPDMPGEFIVGLSVERKFLLAIFPENANDLRRCAFFFKMAFDAEAGRSFQYILLIAPGKIRFGKTEIIDGVEQIGLAHSIISADAYDPIREPESILAVVLELYE